MKSNTLRTRRACDVCQKHTWFSGENCEVCLKKKKNQIVAALTLIIVFVVMMFVALRYFPTGNDQNHEVVAPISQSKFDLIDQPIFLPYDFSDDTVPTGNSFRHYERVYPAVGFELLGYSSEFNQLASNGAVVLDMTRDHIKLLFDDGSIKTYAKAWFISKDTDLDRRAENHEDYWSENWLVGNQFEFGDFVCAVPDSIREPFPNKSIVWKSEGEFVYLLGHSGPINFAHFQRCK